MIAHEPKIVDSLKNQAYTCAAAPRMARVESKSDFSKIESTLLQLSNVNVTSSRPRPPILRSR